MISGVNHIGIAVQSIEESLKTFAKILPISDVHYEIVENQNVRIASFKVGELLFELLEGTSDESAITKFINKKGEGIHHIALTTESIQDDISSAIENNITMIDVVPRPGAHQANVAFIHPKSTHSVLLEFCQPQS